MFVGSCGGSHIGVNSERVKSYKSNYSAYKIQRENEDKHIVKQYKKQPLRINRLNQAIRNRRNRLKSTQKNSDYKNAAKTLAL
ncbi:MAG: hypothetical protein ACOX7U_00785 [Desulfitobacteriia bacterium]